MGWQDDLQNLIGETVSRVPAAVSGAGNALASGPWAQAAAAIASPNDPLHGVADALNPNLQLNHPINNLGDVLHVPGNVVGSALNAMQVPAHAVQSTIGLGEQGLTSAMMALGIGDRAGQQRVIDAYRQGGGQGVWNLMVEHPTMTAGISSPLVAKALMTLGTDPMTYIGLGVGPDVAHALSAAAATANSPVAKGGLIGARAIVEGLQAANDAPGKLLGPLGDAKSAITGTQAWARLHTPGDAADLSLANKGLFDLSAQTKNSLFREKYHGLLEGWNLAQQRIEADPNLHNQLGMAAMARGAGLDQLPETLNPALDAEFSRPAVSDPSKTMGEVLKANLTQAQADFDAVKQAATNPFTGKTAWTQVSPLNDKLNWAARYDKANGTKIESLIRKYANDAAIDPLFGDPVDAAVNTEAKANATMLGLKWQPSNIYPLFAAAFGENALASGRFHTNNFMNGILQNAILGVQHVPSASEILRGYQIARRGVYDPTSVASVSNQLWSEQRLLPYGATLPVETMERGLSQSLGRGRTNPSAGAELIGRVPLPGFSTIAKGYGKIMLWNRQFGQGIETTLRTTPYAQAFDQHMMTALPEIDAEMAARFGGQPPISLVDMRAPVNGQPPAIGALSPENVFNELKNAGVADGQAIHFSRRVAEEQNKARAAGLALMQKAQFSYQKTNIDQWVSKVAPFMYWQTRAIPFYTEEALRHPTLALAYFREMQAADDDNTYAGMDARSKGFVKFLSTYAGFTTLLNPQALWGVAKIYDQPDAFTPEGMTATGQVLNWYKNYGGGLYPWIDAMLNMAGVYGDTFEPDFFPIRQKALISAAAQFARSRAGLPPSGSPMENLMGKIRGDVSQFIADVGAPDWLAKPVYQKAGLSQSEITLDKAIENRIVSNHTIDPATGQTDLTNQQLLDIMTNPNDPEYHRAYQDVAASGLLQQLGNFVLPVNIKIRDAQTDVRSAVTNTIIDHANALGVPPWQFKPLVGDVEFATGYKQLTGRTWTPGQYDRTRLQQDLTNAVPEAKQFILDEHDYNALGNDAYKTYSALLNGGDARTANLPDASRKAYAQQWADREGVAKQVNEAMAAQKMFRATHPEFDAFKQWQSGMFQLQATLPNQSFAHYRDEASRINPDAAQYFQQLQATALRLYPNDPTKRQQYIEQQTTSANAWFMITGRAQMRSENIPVPAAPNTPPVDQYLQSQTQAPPDVATPPWLRNLGVNWSYE